MRQRDRSLASNRSVVAVLEDLRRDLVYAWRSLRRAPSFAIVAVLTVGLGAGAVSVVTSVVYGVLYRPLPFRNADRLVRIVQVIGLNGRESRAGLRPEQVASWQANSRTLTVGYFQWAYAMLADVASPVRLAGASVTSALFTGIAPPPERGRLFTDDDARPGNTRVVLLADRTWRSAFGADPALVGRTIALNLNESGMQPYRVIGIMPDTFGFPSLAAPGLT
jgi:putative ABC transport system permease protein